MKTQDTAAALDELSAAAPPEVVIASAQNGVENERLALRRFPEVYGVCVLLPASSLEPGVVETYMAPVIGRLDVGRYPRGEDATAGALADGVQRARGSRRSARPDIMRFKYGKLVTNLGNAVEAVIGPGEAGREIARLAREEGAACLRAAGIEAERSVTVARACPAGRRPRRGSAAPTTRACSAAPARSRPTTSTARSSCSAASTACRPP